MEEEEEKIIVKWAQEDVETFYSLLIYIYVMLRYVMLNYVTLCYVT